MMLADYPDTFTVVQYHTSGYATSFGNGRAGFYGVGGIPDAWFDGRVNKGGAYTNDTQQYNYYMGAYNERIVIDSDLILELGGEEVTAPTYEFSVRVNNTSGDTEWEVTIHMVQVLNGFPASGGYHSHCMVQHVLTQDITLAPGASQTLSDQITLGGGPGWDTSWTNKENVKIIAWAQRPGTSQPKRVHNAVQMDWPFEPLPDDEYEVGDMNCDGAVNGFDIDPFVLVVGGDLTGYYALYPDCDHMLGDCDDDGDVDGFDIDPFVLLIGGG